MGSENWDTNYIRVIQIYGARELVDQLHMRYMGYANWESNYICVIWGMRSGSLITYVLYGV